MVLSSCWTPARSGSPSPWPPTRSTTHQGCRSLASWFAVVSARKGQGGGLVGPAGGGVRLSLGAAGAGGEGRRRSVGRRVQAGL
jgi:hypothetical protein